MEWIQGLVCSPFNPLDTALQGPPLRVQHVEKGIVDNRFGLDGSTTLRAGIAEHLSHVAAMILQRSHEKLLVEIGRRDVLAFDRVVIQVIVID